MNREPTTEPDAIRRVTVGQLRCAIYTRKSTDQGLDQDFNSLDAQRESAEAFILSQRAEGLVALPERYDDGGFSGGNLDRPALERLLTDIRGGAVDCVVVYKVDRLSRSLIDFARIIEIFEKHNVSFVSVTQQFNTTNSLGRLTLNVLLSFAQFEREIISERTRDKISAARRKGKWIGGRPMLGYDIDLRGSRLIINTDEAHQVRTIFKLYVDRNSLLSVVRELNRRGWRTKEWVTRKGGTHGGKPFTKGRLFRLLRNPIYIGKIDFKKQMYDGEHEAIVEAGIWQCVQQILQRNGRSGGAAVRDSYGTLMKELLRCGSCDGEMIRTYTTKDSRRHRHYVCMQAQQGGCVSCEGKAVSESAIKGAVIKRICRIGSDPSLVARAAGYAEEQRRNSVADLILERDAAQKKLASLRYELCGLGDCRDQVTGCASDLAKRMAQMEDRLTEILEEIGTLESQIVDGDDFRAVVAQFGPVWDSLSCREQAHILRTLVEHIIYNGKTNKVTLSFRSAGIRDMFSGIRDRQAPGCPRTDDPGD